MTILFRHLSNQPNRDIQNIALKGEKYGVCFDSYFVDELLAIL